VTLLFTVVVGLVVAGVTIAAVAARPFLGLAVTGGAFALAAVARLVLPLRGAGMFAVRGRTTDVAFLSAVSAGLVALAASIRASGSA
jgi:hypothetical protein